MIGRLLALASGGTARAVAARAISVLAGFLLTIVVARLLDVEAAGSFFLVFTTLAAIATFGRFGVDNLALKLIGGASADVRLDIGYSAAIALLASATAYAAVAAFLLLTGYGLPRVSAVWLLVVLTAILPQVFAVSAGAVLRARGRLALGTIAELGSIPILTVAILFVVHFADALDPLTALLSLAAASWFSAVWAVPLAIAALRGVPASSRLRTVADSVTFLVFVRRHFSPLASMMGTSLLFYVLTWAPVYVLTIAGSLEEVSLYTAAVRFANLMSIVPTLQVSYLTPAFARLFHSDSIDELNALCRRAVRQVAVVLAIPAIVLVVAARPIVDVLYGRDYADAAVPLGILAAGTFLVALLGQVNPLMLVCDLERHAVVLNGVLLVVWATLGLWVVGAWGVVGSASFSVAVSLIYAGTAVWLLANKRGIRSHLAVSRGSRLE